MSPRTRLLLTLLVVALGGGAALFLRDGEEGPAAADLIRRDGAPSPAAARLTGAVDAGVSTDPTRPVGETESRAEEWRLAFRVLGPDGRPHPFTKAWWADEGGQVADMPSPEAGATEGELRVTGTCRLVVAATGLAPSVSERLDPPAAGRLDLVARLGVGLPLAGTIYHEDGETPYGPATLTAEYIAGVAAVVAARSRQEVAIDVHGRFALRGLLPGHVRLSLRYMDHHVVRTIVVLCDAGDEDVRVEVPIEPTCTLHVYVADTQAGHAPQDTRIAVYVTTDDVERLWVREHLVPRDQPNEHWGLGILDAPRGSTLRFRLVALGYEQSEPFEYRVPADAGPYRVVLPLLPRPEQAAQLTVRLLPSGGPTPRVVTGSYDHPSARFDLERKVVNERISLRLPPGRSRITLEANWDRHAKDRLQKARVGNVEVEMQAGERREIDLSLQRGGLALLVGARDAWAPLFELSRGNETISRETWLAESEGDGRCWALGPVPPGVWSFTYDDPEARWAGEVVIRVGEVTTVQHDQLEKVADLRR